MIRYQQVKVATADAAIQGAGVGAGVGLLTTLFQKDKSIAKAVKNALIGGGIGGVAGAGLGRIASKVSPPEPAPTPAAPKKKLDVNLAALSGLVPIAGPAAYGALASESGDKLGNAARLGGASWGAGLPGGVAQLLAASGGDPKKLMLARLLMFAGSAGGAGAMANHINKTAASFGDRIRQGLSAATESLGNATARPYDPLTSAAMGAIPGVALGGGVGLLKAFLDSEDDGVMSTLGKVLSGAGIGGLGGAALGGGMSALRRNNLLSALPQNADRDMAKKTLGQFELPADGRDVYQLNAARGAAQIASPSLVNHLQKEKTRL